MTGRTGERDPDDSREACSTRAGGSGRSAVAYGLTLAARGGTAAANLATLTVLVRVLSPERLGLFSLAVSTTAILATIAEAGLRTEVVRWVARAGAGMSRTSTRADPGAVAGSPASPGSTIVGGVLSFEYSVGAALAALLLTARAPVNNFFFAGTATTGLFGLVAIGVLVHNAFHLSTALAQGRQDYRRFFAGQMTWAILRFVGIALLAFLSVRDPLAFLAAHVTSLAVAATIILARERGTAIRMLLGDWRRPALRSATGLLRESHWIATGSLLITAMAQLGPLALGHWSTLGEVGRFAAVQRFVQVIQVGISALWLYLLPKVLALEPEGLSAFLEDLRKQLPRVLGLGTAGIGVAWVTVPVFLPDTFGETRPVLLALAAAALIEGYASLLCMIFLNLRAYQTVVAVVFTKLCLGAALMALWVPAWGAGGAAMACVIAEVEAFACLALLAPRLVRRRREDAPCPEVLKAPEDPT